MCEFKEDEIREQKSLFGVVIDDDLINEDAETQLGEIREARSLFDAEHDEPGDTQMQTLGLCDQPETEPRKGFWRRQFQAEPTRRQKQYDWFFGVIMPVVCIFFDPIVFKSWGGDGTGGLLSTYRPFAYTGSFISIMLMMAWLLWREKLGGFSALIAGMFFAASAISLAIGVVLVPFSFLGLIVLIGALGFTPLFTSVIFARNGVRALRAANGSLAHLKLVFATILGSLWGLTIPYVLNVEVNRSLDLIAKGSPATIRLHGLKLRLLAPLVDPGQLQTIYWNAPENSVQRSEIDRLYVQLTGHQVNPRAWFDH